MTQATELAVYKYEPRKAIATKSNLRELATLNVQQISSLMPRNAPVKRLVGELLVAASENPVILQCTQASLVRCIAAGAITGLHIAGPMQHAAIIPRRNHGVMEASFDPMYKGLLKLASQCANLKAVQVSVIYSNDEWEIAQGTNGEITHKPLMVGDRGHKVAVYAVFKMDGGAAQSESMRADEVEAIRIRAERNKKSGFSPWKTDADEMWKKTVLKRGLKRVPSATENEALMHAISFSNELEGFDNLEPTEPGERGKAIFDAAGVERAEDGEPIPASAGM